MPHDNISQLGVDDNLVFKGMCVFLFLSCKYTISELIVLILHTISLHLDAFSLFCNGSFHDYKQYNCSGVWFWDPRQHSHVSAFLNSSIYSWERFEQAPCLNSLRGHFVCVFCSMKRKRTRHNRLLTNELHVAIENTGKPYEVDIRPYPPTPPQQCCRSVITRSSEREQSEWTAG